MLSPYTLSRFCLTVTRLKDEPKVLLSLLSQLVSDPWMATTRRLLTVTDDLLELLYSRDVDSNAHGLECLHLVGRLFAQSSGSDMTELILTMPHGLCKWIADEDSILTRDEHQEVVSWIESARQSTSSFFILGYLRLLDRSREIVHR